jgi:hypothetical protein
VAFLSPGAEGAGFGDFALIAVVVIVMQVAHRLAMTSR